MGIREVLLDRREIQRIQDSFCKVHGVYVQLIGIDGEQYTEFCEGAKKREFFVSAIAPEERQQRAWKMRTSIVESFVDENTLDKCILSSLVPVRIEKETIAYWWICASLRPDDEYNIKAVTETVYETAVVSLISVSEGYFSIKLEQSKLIEENASEGDDCRYLREEIKKKDLFNKILQMTASNESFTDIINFILEHTAEYLQVNYGGLIRLNGKQNTADLIAQWTSESKYDYMALFQNQPIEKIPFLTGKPYMISSDSVLPDRFSKFFRTYRIRAAVALPVELKGRITMYLVFGELGSERIWKKEEVHFLNDIRKVIQNLLDKRITANSITSSYVMLESMLENMSCGVFVREHQERRLLYTNRMLESMVQVSSKNVMELFMSTKHLNQKNEVFIKEEQRWFEVLLREMEWVDGHTVLLGTVYDITDKKNYEIKMEREVNHDALTGLYNRKKCQEHLNEVVNHAKNVGTPGAIIYMDIDDFKVINDGLGHEYGDVLLREISHDLVSLQEIEDCCYHVGGDDFIIVIRDYKVMPLAHIISEVQSIFKKTWHIKNTEYRCSVSMGISKFPADGTDVEDLIKKADIALHEAKKRGRGCVEYYSEEVAFSSVRRFDIEKNIKQAVQDECNEFKIFYQPMLQIRDGEVVCRGAEALLRWDSKELGMIMPKDFIPLSEYLGLVGNIGYHILRQACSECRQWNELGHPEYMVTVNLSIVQLMQNSVVEEIKRIIDETGVNPGNLILDITENFVATDVGRMNNVLKRLREIGVIIALDDFGKGYTSLKYIRELPIDMIKIDQCLIRDDSPDSVSDVLVESLKNIARAMGIAVCIEGVETEKQFQMLVEHGVDMVQGYYIDRPMKTESFKAKYL